MSQRMCSWWMCAGALGAALLASCVDGGADSAEPAARISPNGIELQGNALNGVQLQGTSPNGVNMQGMSLNGYDLGGRPLFGTRFDPPVLVNTPFRGILSNGESINVRVEQFAVIPDSGEIWGYTVSFQAQQGWKPLCGLDASGAPRQALPVPGTFDNTRGTPTGGSYTASSTLFTFACREAGIAKCVEFGYAAPARIDHLVACTRMLRADYCGDGRSFTLDGTLINLYDGIGVEADRASWPFEAEWNTQGARCVSPTTTLRWVGVVAAAPSCLASKASATCGDLSHFGTGTLVMDEYNGR